MCKVDGCNETHSKHFCTLCKKDDVTHFAMNCSEGIDLWHGTRMTNLIDISLNKGLKASNDGRLGKGVYFANKEVATAVSRYRGKGTGVLVICCRVYLGKKKECGTASDKTWHGQYDSACGIHPSWAGVPPFTEYCLGDETRHRIKEVHITDGEVHGEVYLPRVDIIVKGSVTFRCNVTAGRLNIG